MCVEELTDLTLKPCMRVRLYTCVLGRARVSVSVCCLRRAVGDPQRTGSENFDHILHLNITEISI